jgi:hypothetical protein
MPQQNDLSRSLIPFGDPPGRIAHTLVHGLNLANWIDWLTRAPERVGKNRKALNCLHRGWRNCVRSEAS